MRDIELQQITPGRFFSEPSYLDDGFILTVPEIPVTQRLLDILDAWGYAAIKTDGVLQDSYNSAGTKSTVTLFNDTGKLETAKAFFDDLARFTKTVFTKAEETGKLSYNVVAEKMRESIKEVQTNKRYILQIERDASSGDGQLVSHAVRSAIFSIILGTQLKMPAHRMIELAAAALVHEIGMIKLPQGVYAQRGELTPQERDAIQKHPMLGFSLLKENGFPVAVSAAAAEHHERENGLGYPRKLTGNNISEYSKIISVACSYEAITSNRPYHLARSGFEGIIDIMKNKNQGYDDNVVKALVVSMSIYPIGSSVLLSNNQKALVIDSNPVNPRFPIVQLMEVTGADGKNPIVETSPLGLNIVRPL